MVLTKKKDELSPENILKHVSEADIVMAFWPAGKELEFNRAISSPFRTDNDPSFIIGNKYGPVTFKDMGALQYRGDIWSFVKQIEGLRDFGQVLRKIDERFNLGYGNGQPIVGKSQEITWEAPEIKHYKPPIIQVSVRKFNKLELQWWNQYGQDISDLKREEIYAPDSIWRNRKKIPIMDLTFCYFFPDIGKWKLYRPMAPKKQKKTPPWQWKWDNSMTNLQYIEGLSNLKNSQVGIVNKARKCRMVITKATGITSVCNVQAEDPSAISEEDMKFIDDNCKLKVAVMDSDKKGKEFSTWLTTTHQFKHCNTPDHLLDENINDFADWARYYGLDAVRSHFIHKGFIKE